MTLLEDPFVTDLGLDVRAEMHDLFADGVDDWATPMLARWADALEDPDDKDIVLLAMAITAWEAGRVDATVQARALALLGDASPVAKRLQKKPPKPKSFKRRSKHETALELGDVVALRLPAGTWVALVVWDFHQDKGGRYPIVDVLDWRGAKKPKAKALATIEAAGQWFDSEPKWRKSSICISGLRSKRGVIAKNVGRPKADHLAPSIGLWTFLRLNELEPFLLNRMRAGDSSKS